MTAALDVSAIAALADAIGRDIRNHYEGRPQSPEQVWEVLQALAVCVGSVLAGTGNSEEAAQFFFHAVECASRRAEEVMQVGHG